MSYLLFFAFALGSLGLIVFIFGLFQESIPLQNFGFACCVGAILLAFGTAFGTEFIEWGIEHTGATVKSDILKEASEFCIKQGKELNVVNTSRISMSSPRTTAPALIFTHRSHASAVNSSSLSLALLIPFFRRNASSLRPFWITVFIGLVLWFLLEALLA